MAGVLLPILNLPAQAEPIGQAIQAVGVERVPLIEVAVERSRRSIVSWYRLTPYEYDTHPESPLLLRRWTSSSTPRA